MITPTNYVLNYTSELTFNSTLVYSDKKCLRTHVITVSGQNVDGQNVDGQNVDNFGNIGQNVDSTKKHNSHT